MPEGGYGPQCHDAVLVLPGIMGTELVESGTGDVLWGLSVRKYVDLWTGGAPWQKLLVTEDEWAGIVGRVTPTRLLRAPAFAPLLLLARNLTLALMVGIRRIMPHPDAVLEFPYDWRLPVAFNAGKLAVTAERHLKTWRAHPNGRRDAKLVIVAHSLGGPDRTIFYRCTGRGCRCPADNRHSRHTLLRRGESGAYAQSGPWRPGSPAPAAHHGPGPDISRRPRSPAVVPVRGRRCLWLEALAARRRVPGRKDPGHGPGNHKSCTGHCRRSARLTCSPLSASSSQPCRASDCMMGWPSPSTSSMTMTAVLIGEVTGRSTLRRPPGRCSRCRACRNRTAGSRVLPKCTPPYAPPCSGASLGHPWEGRRSAWRYPTPWSLASG